MHELMQKSTGSQERLRYSRPELYLKFSCNWGSVGVLHAAGASKGHLRANATSASCMSAVCH